MSLPIEAILAEARRWIGTPWHHEARVHGAGVDCAQLLIAVYSAAGLIPEIQTDHYPPDWHLHRDEKRFMGYLLQFAEPIDAPEAGCVVMFNFGRHAAHGGIVEAWPLVIHAWKDEGAVTRTDVETSHLRDRVAGFYRLRATA